MKKYIDKRTEIYNPSEKPGGWIASPAVGFLILSLLVGLAAGCAEENNGSTDDVQDISRDDSVQGLAQSDGDCKSPSFSEVCKPNLYPQLESINKKCFQKRLEGPKCAKTCKLLHASPGTKVMRSEFKRDANGNYIRDANGKTIAEIVEKDDGCCFRAVAGKYPGQPLWLPSQDADCPAIDCRDESTWPAVWAYKEEKILTALNAQREKETTCTKRDRGCSAAVGPVSVAQKRLIIDPKLRQAARCHAMEQAQMRCQSHNGSPIEGISVDEKGNPLLYSTFHHRALAAEYPYETGRYENAVVSTTPDGATRTQTEIQGNFQIGEILRYWTKNRWSSNAEEIEGIIQGFMDSYYHCLPLMNKVERAKTAATCGTLEAPYKHVGIGVVDLDEVAAARNRPTCPKPDIMRESSYQATIKFGVPK